MQVFIVIGADPELVDKIMEVYKDHRYYILSCHAWAIGTTHKTPSDVANSLGISAEGKIAGIVVQADSYNGWYEVDLWEKCRLWEQSNG